MKMFGFSFFFCYYRTFEEFLHKAQNCYCSCNYFLSKRRDLFVNVFSFKILWQERKNKSIPLCLLHRRLKVHIPDTTYLSVPNSVAKKLKNVRIYFVAARNIIRLGALDMY